MTAKQKRGQALIEASLMVPMIFFLFLGLTNFGFYVYAFIQVGNAARVGAQHASNTSFAGNSSAACDVVLRELRALPNVAPLANCSASPLQVTAVPFTDSLGGAATQVTVVYNTIQLYPLPFMSGQMTINRTAYMRLLPT